jgi:hypothetical protein
MKKIFSIIFAGAFVFALFISGCSSENSSQNASDKSPSPTAVEPKGFLTGRGGGNITKVNDIKGVLAVDTDGCIYIDNNGERILPTFRNFVEPENNGLKYFINGVDKYVAKIGTDMSNLDGFWLTKKQIEGAKRVGINGADPKSDVCDVSKYSKYYYFRNMPGREDHTDVGM